MAVMASVATPIPLRNFLPEYIEGKNLSLRNVQELFGAIKRIEKFNKGKLLTSDLSCALITRWCDSLLEKGRSPSKVGWLRDALVYIWRGAPCPWRRGF
jgi:hypothetical protein